MNQFKTLTLTFLVILTTNLSVTAQRIIPLKTGFQIDENITIFHKLTGQRISHKEFSAIIKKNPQVHLEQDINERGEITTLIYDPNGSGITTLNPDLQIKPDQPFPNFIFTTTQKEEIDSKKLRDNVIVLYCNMAFKEPFASQKLFDDFENTIKSSHVKNNITPIILTNSNIEYISSFTDFKVPYPIVTNANNFFRKYVVIKFPSFIVTKKDGKLAAYANDLDELKLVLSKLE